MIGLQGQTNNTAIIIESLEDVNKLDFSRDIYLFSQTTMSVEGFEAIKSEVSNRKSNDIVFEAHDTICRNVANRVANLQAFAREQDVVLFVGGRKSSNAKVLFQHCLEANPNTFFIEGPEEIESLTSIRETVSLLSAERSKIGITGATSTPLWLMEKVKTAVERLS